MNRLLSAAVIGAGLFLSGCTYSESGCMVGHYCLVPFDGGSANARDWIPTANATGPVDMVAAKCDMIAHGAAPAGGEVFAAGSPAFVSGAMAGATLGQGMRTMASVQNTIHDCMVMNGFRRAG